MLWRRKAYLMRLEKRFARGGGEGGGYQKGRGAVWEVWAASKWGWAGWEVKGS